MDPCQRGDRPPGPELFKSLAARPLAWLATALFIAGLGTSALARRAGRDLPAWLGSCAFLLGLLGATAAASYPILIRAAGAPARSLTAFTAPPPANRWPPASAGGRVGFCAGRRLHRHHFRLHRGRVRAADGEGY